jgi:hypothetical protein
MTAFTACIRSLDKITGTPDDYTVHLPIALPQGLYRARFSIIANVPGITELRIRWPGAVTHLSTRRSDGYATVLVFEVNEATGCLYLQDGGQEIGVRMVNAETGQITTGTAEHVIVIELAPVTDDVLKRFT